MYDKKEPQIKISRKLFSCLVYYHVLGYKDNFETNTYIKIELEKKLEKAAAHDQYTKQILERNGVID